MGRKNLWPSFERFGGQGPGWSLSDECYDACRCRYRCDLVPVQKSFPGFSVSGLLAWRPLTASLITLAEIEYGMEAKNWGSVRRDLMHRFLGRFTPLLPDSETAVLWARIKSNCDKKGRQITFADAWIAAAAVHLNIPLVTHNAGDYAAVDALTILTAPSRTGP